MATSPVFARSGRAAKGMTLMEVLAAVFILGMGLIMVAGAFPVGADQTRRTVEETQSATIARTALEICREEKIVRNLTQGQYGASDSRPLLKSDHTRVWNPERWAYLEQWNDSKMWPPSGGDYMWQAFVTRVSETNEVPLMRLTIVVVKYSQSVPEFIHPDMDPWLLRTINVANVINAETLEGGNLTAYDTYNVDTRYARTDRRRVKDESVIPGDYLMDPRTGFCVCVSGKITEGLTKVRLKLASEPAVVPTTGSQYAFHNVVGVYTVLLSE